MSEQGGAVVQRSLRMFRSSLHLLCFLVLFAHRDSIRFLLCMHWLMGMANRRVSQLTSQ